MLKILMVGNIELSCFVILFLCINLYVYETFIIIHLRSL